MKNSSGTKQEIKEISVLSHRIKELEHSESELKRVHEVLLMSKRFL